MRALPPAPSYSEHIRTLAMWLGCGFQVRPAWTDFRWVLRGKGDSNEVLAYLQVIAGGYIRTVVVTHDPDTNIAAYASALHELGHVATIPWQRRPRALFGYYNPRPMETYQKYIVYYERVAWEWARQHALAWTAEMERISEIALNTYTSHRPVIENERRPPIFYPGGTDGKTSCNTDSRPDDFRTRTGEIRLPRPGWHYWLPERRLAEVAVAADKLRGTRIAHPNE